jgi:hypothetical protein
MELDIEIGKVYRITHTRKGAFIAEVIDIVSGDDVDDQFITVKFDVRHGTSQEHMAGQPGQQVRVSNLRPSLITHIQETEEGSWLREVKVSLPPQPQKPESFLTKARKFIGV